MRRARAPCALQLRARPPAARPSWRVAPPTYCRRLFSQLPSVKTAATSVVVVPSPAPISAPVPVSGPAPASASVPAPAPAPVPVVPGPGLGSGPGPGTDLTPSRRSRIGSLAVILAVGALTFTTLDYLFPSSSSSPPDRLNRRTFTPYTLVAKEPVSPTSVILTLRPPGPQPACSGTGAAAAAPALGWPHDLWSVEVAHPAIQIARWYTPLPPLSDPGDGSDTDAPGTVRLFVRVRNDGEMTRYLDSIKVGGEVQLRGPHPGFALRERLGDSGELVFLAGGTGIAPAMQAIYSLMGERDQGGDEKAGQSSRPRITVLWAVRRAEEVRRRRGRDTDQEMDAETAEEELTPIARDLAALKRRYGPGVTVRVLVDSPDGAACGSMDVDAIESAMSLTAVSATTASPSSSVSVSSRRRRPLPVRDVAPPAASLPSFSTISSAAATPAPSGRLLSTCRFHNPWLAPFLGRGDEEKSWADVDGERRAVVPHRPGEEEAEEEGGCDGAGGKVVLVSGPEGFVGTVAGRMIYRDGGALLLQGRPRGLLGEVLTRRHPGAAREWTVLRLDG